MDPHYICYYKELFSRRKAIRYKWIFKVKYKPNKEIKRYKARLVKQDFSQVSKVNFTETFVLTIRLEFLRIFLPIATLLDLILIQMDVFVAYLKNALK